MICGYFIVLTDTLRLTSKLTCTSCILDKLTPILQQIPAGSVQRVMGKMKAAIPKAKQSQLKRSTVTSSKKASKKIANAKTVKARGPKYDPRRDVNLQYCTPAQRAYYFESKRKYEASRPFTAFPGSAMHNLDGRLKQEARNRKATTFRSKANAADIVQLKEQLAVVSKRSIQNEKRSQKNEKLSKKKREGASSAQSR